MKRILISALAAMSLVAFAAASASAATVSVATDAASYNVGDTIILTVTADSEGDTGQLISITITHDTAAVSGNGATQPADVFTQANGAFAATPGGLQGTCGGVFGANGCNAFDQLLGNAGPIDAGPKQAILSYTASGTFSGLLNGTGSPFGLKTVGTGAYEFAGSDSSIVDFSGAAITIVPEPTTAALLGLGLLGIAMGGRRRS